MSKSGTITVITLRAESHCTLDVFTASTETEACEFAQQSLEPGDAVSYVLRGEVIDWSDKSDRWVNSWKNRDFTLIFLQDRKLHLRKFRKSSVEEAMWLHKLTSKCEPRIVAYIDGHYDFMMYATLDKDLVSNYELHGYDYDIVRESNGLYSVYSNNICVQPDHDADGIMRYLSHVIQGLSYVLHKQA